MYNKDIQILAYTGGRYLCTLGGSAPSGQRASGKVLSLRMYTLTLTHSENDYWSTLFWNPVLS